MHVYTWSQEIPPKFASGECQENPREAFKYLPVFVYWSTEDTLANFQAFLELRKHSITSITVVHCSVTAATQVGRGSDEQIPSYRV